MKQHITAHAIVRYQKAEAAPFIEPLHVARYPIEGDVLIRGWPHDHPYPPFRKPLIIGVGRLLFLVLHFLDIQRQPVCFVPRHVRPLPCKNW